MNRIDHIMSEIMSEIARLRIENAELRKNILVRKLQSSAVEPGIQKSDTSVMFSDKRGFEQFPSPTGTRGEKFGFMSEDQKKRHRYDGYPIGIAHKFFE